MKVECKTVLVKEEILKQAIKQNNVLKNRYQIKMETNNQDTIQAIVGHVWKKQFMNKAKKDP